MNENDMKTETFNMGFMRNYLDHLDREGLYQLMQFLLVDDTARSSIIMMAQEWNKMYGPINRYGGSE